MMVYSFLLTTLGFLVACSWGAADDIVRSDRIKVFLYAAPAFFQEVTIDAYKDSCTDLDNSLCVFLSQLRLAIVADVGQDRWPSAVDIDRRTRCRRSHAADRRLVLHLLQVSGHARVCCRKSS